MYAFAKAVESIFDSEGSEIGETWQPLSRVTEAERADFGYSGPMLYREGFLRRSLTDPSMGPQTIFVWEHGLMEDEKIPHQGGNTYTVEKGQGTTHLRFATLDDRFMALQGGRQQPNPMPGRPMVPGDEHGKMVGQTIDNDMRKLIDEILNG